MFGLLSRKVKPPPELVRTTREAIMQLEQSSSGSEPPAKVSEELSRNLSSMKLLLYGEPDQRPNPEAASELARERFSANSAWICFFFASRSCCCAEITSFFAASEASAELSSRSMAEGVRCMLAMVRAVHANSWSSRVIVGSRRLSTRSGFATAVLR